MNLSISPTRQGYQVEARLYEHLDSGQENPLADIPPTEIPALVADRDGFNNLLECLMFWCTIQARHAESSWDVYLF